MDSVVLRTGPEPLTSPSYELYPSSLLPTCAQQILIIQWLALRLLHQDPHCSSRVCSLCFLSPLLCVYISVQLSHSVVSNSLWPHEPQHARPPCPSPTPGVHPNPRPSSLWCHPTSSSSVVLFSSYPQSFSASGSFQMSQLFTSGGQSIGVSLSASVLPMNIKDWAPLGWTGWISLQSKGLSRVFSNTTIQKHQFFAAQFSL